VDPLLPTILVADDDAQIRAVLGRFLTRDGFNVLLAADGREALELFARTPGIAVAVIDLVMPNREGIETIQEIRRQCPRVKIVAMSGAFNGDFLPAARLLGADATVAKPVQLTVFRDTLWAVLNERNQGAASSV
jgi:two-component system, cell cycle sensor histidine kinase and response regulator CckA